MDLLNRRQPAFKTGVGAITSLVRLAASAGCFCRQEGADDAWRLTPDEIDWDDEDEDDAEEDEEDQEGEGDEEEGPEWYIGSTA